MHTVSPDIVAAVLFSPLVFIVQTTFNIYAACGVFFGLQAAFLLGDRYHSKRSVYTCRR